MENVVWDRTEALRALGHEVTVIHASDGTYSDAFARQCVAECDKCKPDVIHLDSFDRERPWWIARKEFIALTMHSNPWSLFFTKWNLWRHGHTGVPSINLADLATQCDIIRHANVVLAISRYEHRLLLDACGVPQARLVYNPIPSYFFDTPRVPVPTNGHFLHFGTSNTRGHNVAVAAAKVAGVELRVASGLSRPELVQVYDGCKALVLPSFRADGFDLTVAEATARCRPVITYYAGAYSTECAGALPLGDMGAVVRAMQRPLPTVAADAANAFRPANHAAAWLKAIGR